MLTIVKYIYPRLVGTSRQVVGATGSLYVAQREFAATHPHDTTTQVCSALQVHFLRVPTWGYNLQRDVVYLV